MFNDYTQIVEDTKVGPQYTAFPGQYSIEWDFQQYEILGRNPWTQGTILFIILIFCYYV